FFQAEDGIRVFHVTGVQTCALPICAWHRARPERPVARRRHVDVVAAPARAGPSGCVPRPVPVAVGAARHAGTARPRARDAAETHAWLAGRIGNAERHGRSAPSAPLCGLVIGFTAKPHRRLPAGYTPSVFEFAIVRIYRTRGNTLVPMVAVGRNAQCSLSSVPANLIVLATR